MVAEEEIWGLYFLEKRSPGLSYSAVSAFHHSSVTHAAAGSPVAGCQVDAGHRQRGTANSLGSLEQGGLGELPGTGISNKLHGNFGEGRGRVLNH